MRRSKKIILIALMSIVVLAGTIGGVAFAQTDEEVDQPTAVFDRVTTILNEQGITITSDQLKDAFTQAGQDIRDEALDKYLDKLVSEGKLDEQQALDYKAWLDSKPADLPALLDPGIRGRIRPFGGFGRFGGGSHGFCQPETPEE
jgi:hypothetical protein